MDHCIYCGAAFPPDLKEGFAEPEALKWVDRPALPPDIAKQLEMMKVVPLDSPGKPRSVLARMAFLSIPAFTVIFYFLYQIVTRYVPSLGPVIVVFGAVFLLYLAWSLKKSMKI